MSVSYGIGKKNGSIFPSLHWLYLRESYSSFSAESTGRDIVQVLHNGERDPGWLVPCHPIFIVRNLMRLARNRQSGVLS